MSTQPKPRSLADQFRSWSDEQLTVLLQARPDLGLPAPTSSRQLASRAVEMRSTLMAMAELSSFELLVLQSLCQEEELDADQDEIEAAVGHLTELGLVWGDPPTTTSTVRDRLLAATGPEELDPTQLTPTQLALLQQLDQRFSDGSLPAQPGPATELIESGWLSIVDKRDVRLTWNARLALRRQTGRPLSEPPDVPTSPREAELVDRMAAGAAFEVCRRVEVLLDRWSIHPPPKLRSGGLGVRDLKAVTELLHVDSWEAGLIVELAHATGLLGTGPTMEIDNAWLPSREYDEWLRLPVHERWLNLAWSWLENDREIGLVGTRVDNKRVNALAPGLRNSWIAQLREDMLTQMPQVVGETLAATTGLPALRERIKWAHPMRATGRPEAIAELLKEASAIGVTGLDGLSTLGRALLDEDAAPDLSTIFPAPIKHVLLQADLTAVAPGPLSTDVAQRIAKLADVESRGGATVHRFSADSIRRAFDAGWTAGEIHDFLAGISRTEVPQPLTYLVDDVARRFGTLRVGGIESFLRSDDPGVLNELLHLPALADLRLRQIAPTVVICDVPLETLLERIRETGLAPMVEAPDGSVQVNEPREWRAIRYEMVSPASFARDIAHINAMINSIRVGDEAEANGTNQGSENDPGDIIATLRQALEGRRNLVVTYVGNDGTLSERIVQPIRVQDGQLFAIDLRSTRRRFFSIHRIFKLRAL
jgi:hypothetical protein